MNDVILETVHGSHLYGLSHSESDHDVFRVTRGGTRTRHVVNGDADLTEMPLNIFLDRVFGGSHQSCEALFSPVATVAPEFKAYFDNYRVTGADVFNKYRRTIKKFSYGTYKQRRHAVRLGYNLAELQRSGRFNPVLNEEQIYTVRRAALTLEPEDLYDFSVGM